MIGSLGSQRMRWRPKWCHPPLRGRAVFDRNNKSTGWTEVIIYTKAMSAVRSHMMRYFNVHVIWREDKNKIIVHFWKIQIWKTAWESSEDLLETKNFPRRSPSTGHTVTPFPAVLLPSRSYQAGQLTTESEWSSARLAGEWTSAGSRAILPGVWGRSSDSPLARMFLFITDSRSPSWVSEAIILKSRTANMNKLPGSIVIDHSYTCVRATEYTQRSLSLSLSLSLFPVEWPWPKWPHEFEVKVLVCVRRPYNSLPEKSTIYFHHSCVSSPMLRN